MTVTALVGAVDGEEPSQPAQRVPRREPIDCPDLEAANGPSESVLPESGNGEDVQPAADDGGLGSGVEAGTRDVEVGEAVSEADEVGPGRR